MRSDLDVRPPGPLRRSTYGVPQRSLRRRAVMATGRGGVHIAGWMVRRGYRHRVRLAPMYLAMLMWLIAFGLHTSHTGWSIAFLPAGLGALLVVGYGRYRGREGRKLPARHHSYLWGCWGAGTGWLTVATAIGPTATALPGVLLVGAIAAGVPYWWHRRIRSYDMDDIPDSDLNIDPEIACWVAKVQGGNNPVLPGAELTGFDRLDNGWRSDIRFNDHTVGFEELANHTVALSRVFDVPLPNVAVRPSPDGRPSRAHITVLTRNPLIKPVVWAGPSLTADGVIRLGSHPDGREALYRFWRPDSGAVHDLISGATDSGKSRVVDGLLANERHSTGLICSWIIDPQGGQSLPAWRGATDEYATTAEDGVDLLEYAVDVMFTRNKDLADREWVDGKGRARRGVDYFEPTVDMPLISITVEEAQNVLQYERAVKAAEKLAGMARKCGLKLRLITQLPLLPQLGNSMYLRGQVASGNVIVLRTAEALTGQVAFNGALPGADPHLLPRAWPDGSTTAGLGYLLGASSHQAMFRADFLDRDDVYDWVTSGDTVHLDGASKPVRPEPAALTAVAAAAPGAADAASPAPDLRLPTRDRVLAYVQAAPGAVRTGIVAAQLGIGLPSASKTLKQLAADGLIHDLPNHGEYLANRATA